MKPFLTIATLLLALTTLTACGGSDDNGDITPEPTVEAPKVESVFPADGSKDLDPTIAITVTYDQNIIFVESDYTKIQATSGTVSSAKAIGKQLNINLVCNPGVSTTVTIPLGIVKNTKSMPAPEVKVSYTTKAAPQTEDGHESATQAVLNMGPGWNLGNTLDSHGSWIGDHQSPDKYETMWGQPQADANLMRKLKEKGFGAIRVPVTWYQHMQADGSVDKDWMDRVQEVVDYVINAGMYCILNVHHDTGAHDVAWVVADASAYDAGKARYEKLWTEIATRFANYGDKLVFEAYNEILDKSYSWTQPKSTSSYGAVTNWGESFVKAVRATGGNNQYRNLVISTYSAATSEQTLKNFKMPTDASQNHLIVEVHSYDPWNWVNTYNMTWTKECHQALVEIFGRLQKYIISKGWPVIVGEYGSNGDGEKTINASSTAAQKAEAGRQAADMSRLCRQYGAACFYWMGIIEGADRAERTFHWSMEQVADSIVNVYKN